MKIQSKKMFKKPLIIVAAIMALLAVSALTYVYVFNGSTLDWDSHKTSSDDTPLTNLDKPTDEQIEAGEEIKRESVEKNEAINENSSDQSGEIGTVSVIITAAEQSSGQLVIRSLIQTVSNEGTCTLTLQKTDGTTVTKTAGVQASASSSTCKGFDVPVSELSPGEWRITVNYKSESLEGAAGHTVTIT